MSSDEEKEERRSLTSGRLKKKPHAKTTFTYKVGDPSDVSSYGSISDHPSQSKKGKGGNGMRTVSSDSEISTHCHENIIRGHDSNTKARKTLIIASVLCLFFMIVEVVGGYIAGSLAIMTDAAHLLSDFASFMISLVSLFLASRPATRRMSFGWHRAEVIGAVVSVLMIWLLTGILVYVAIERIIKKDYEINAVVMVVTATVGVVVNLIMGFVLHRGGHGHSHGGGGFGASDSHGHSHNGGSKLKQKRNSAPALNHAPTNHVFSQSGETWIEVGTPDQVHLISEDPLGRPAGSTSILSDDEDTEGGRNKWFRLPWRRGPRKPHKSGNINVRAALVHVIGDFVQSVGILVAALIIYFRPDLAIMDPICTFIFSILVLITTINVMRDALNVLMEGLPRGMSFSEVAVALESLHGVIKVHDLRIWSLTMDKVALSVHLAVDEQRNTQDILRQATQMLRERFQVYECTVQIEHYSNAMDECKGCEHPQR